MKKTLKPKRLFVNPVFKDRATVLKTAHETGGAYTLGELEVAPGGKNFMHTHSAFEETFTAVKGKLGVMLNSRKYLLQPGESITIPKFAPHYFFNDGTENITCHVKFVPGHDGFVKGLAIAYGLAADGKTNQQGIPKSLAHLALTIDLTDTQPTGLLKLLFPFLKWLAARARKKGTEQKLLEQYYYE